MASTTVAKLVVTKLTKYGFQVADGSYVNYSKKFPEAEKTQIVPGFSFDGELYIADSGTQYLNKVLGGSATASAPAVAPKAVDSDRAKRFTPKGYIGGKKSNDMSKEEWAEKDVRISRQGCIQAAVHALAPVLGENVFEAAAALADKMLAYVNQK